MSEYINNQSREHKEVLKKLIRELHAGGDLAEIKARFSALIGDVSAVEIARMEQELIDEGLPAEEVKRLCDVHVSVFQEALEGQTAPEMTPGHPMHTFKYENLATEEVLKLLEEAIAGLPADDALAQARAFAEQLSEVTRIYSRKENLLFPFLEQHGVSGPSSVMWATHDDIRARLKELRQALQEGRAERIREVFGPLATAIRQMFYKEEHILYPTALKVLSEAEWLAIRAQSDELGYCLIRPGDQWRPTVTRAAELPKAKAYTVETTSGEIKLDTGALTAEQLNLMLKRLPFDVTFVDEQDTVRYYTQGPERIFARTPAIIGRKVQNCYPPKSVHIVNRLLDEFRAGKRDSAEFWIQMAGKFVYIRYLALRDAEGRYRGTIEITQDIAPLRKLEGERRLLEEAK
jgi:hypothetical protein